MTLRAGSGTFSFRLVPGAAAGVSEVAVDPEHADSAIESWTTVDGATYAHEYRVGDLRCVRLPGVGIFAADASGSPDQILVFPAAGVSEHTIDLAVRRGVAAVFAQGAGLEVLHASAVLAPAGVVGFCGRPRSGKSTIAYALATRGYRQWADDALAFDALGPVPLAIPLPFAPRLRRSSAVHLAFRASAQEARPVHPAPIAAIFVLHRRRFDERDRIEFALPAPVDRFLTALSHASYFDLPTEARRERMVAQFLALADAVPVRTVSFRPGLQHLELLLDRIESHLQAIP